MDVELNLTPRCGVVWRGSQRMSFTQWNGTEMAAGVPWLLVRRQLRAHRVCGSCPDTTAAGGGGGGGTHEHDSAATGARAAAAEEGRKGKAGGYTSGGLQTGSIDDGDAAGLRDVLVFSVVAEAKVKELEPQLASQRCYAAYHEYDPHTPAEIAHTGAEREGVPARSTQGKWE